MATKTTKRPKAGAAAPARFASRYTDRKVGFAQLMVERLCERKVRAERDVPLGPHFWREPKWAQFFRRQVAAVSSLVAECGPDAVRAAFERPDLSWMLSFGSPGFAEAVRTERNRAAAVKAVADTPWMPPPIPAASGPPGPDAAPVATPLAGVTGRFAGLEDD